MLAVPGNTDLATISGDVVGHFFSALILAIVPIVGYGVQPKKLGQLLEIFFASEPATHGQGLKKRREECAPDVLRSSKKATTANAVCHTQKLRTFHLQKLAGADIFLRLSYLRVCGRYPKRTTQERCPIKNVGNDEEDGFPLPAFALARRSATARKREDMLRGL